jgi:hypothetical protein
MIVFGEITSKSLRVNYTKDDIEGYKVVGSVNYNKENKLADANGEIRDMEEKRIANFNVYGEGEYARINLTDCLAGRMGDAVAVAETTLADLAASYPEE